MKRLHTTNQHISDLKRRYVNHERNRYFKPAGLWYGLDDDWFEWCSGENFDGIGKFTFDLVINLGRIIVIETPVELILFYHKYKHELYPGYFAIDWDKVKSDYSGIEIRNYYAMRWDVLPMEGSTWFYGWDVNSGCIWDLSVIESVNRTETSPAFLPLKAEYTEK
jgi:hypothetical protein